MVPRGGVSFANSVVFQKSFFTRKGLDRRLMVCDFVSVLFSERFFAACNLRLVENPQIDRHLGAVKICDKFPFI